MENLILMSKGKLLVAGLQKVQEALGMRLKTRDFAVIGLVRIGMGI